MTSNKSQKPDEPAVVVSNPNEWKGELKALGGSMCDDWNNLLANQTMQALWLKHSDEHTRAIQMRATAAAMIGVAPKDELEGMIAAQMLAAHNAAMECYRRAMLPEQSLEGRRENLAQANKLSRTSIMLLDALNKHRGKGQQKVTVEHVHVHAGGQAVVGVVEPGGGDRTKNKEQAHAKQVAHAPQPQVPGSFAADRQAVPVAGDEER